jgi:hypothetical protein
MRVAVRMAIVIVLVLAVVGCGSSAPATSKTEGGARTAGKQYIRDATSRNYAAMTHEMSTDALKTYNCMSGTCNPDPAYLLLGPGMTTTTFEKAKMQISGNWAYVRFPNRSWMRFVYSNGTWLFNDWMGT